MEPRFIQEYYERCGFIAEVIIEHDENKTNELNQFLTEQWDQVMSIPTFFHGKLIR